ncbi:MAG: methyl-accepting chemotaxis protein [Polyangiaceae bacterium]
MRSSGANRRARPRVRGRRGRGLVAREAHGSEARDIEGLIQTIKEQTTAAVASMDRGTTEVDTGTQLVSNTLGDLGRLIGVVRDTARAVQEQAVVSDEIARNMDAVGRDRGALEARRSPSRSRAPARKLAFQQESIGGFNLDGQKRPDPYEPPVKSLRERKTSSPKALLRPRSGGDTQG